MYKTSEIKECYEAGIEDAIVKIARIINPSKAKGMMKSISGSEWKAKIDALRKNSNNNPVNMKNLRTSGAKAQTKSADLPKNIQHKADPYEGLANHQIAQKKNHYKVYKDKAEYAKTLR